MHCWSCGRSSSKPPKRLPASDPSRKTLRWGEPSYLTSSTKSATTIRIGWKPRHPDYIAIYVHCQTSLVDEYRRRYGDTLQFEGNRAVLLMIGQPLPVAALQDCIRLALIYHKPATSTGAGR